MDRYASMPGNLAPAEHAPPAAAGPLRTGRRGELRGLRGIDRQRDAAERDARDLGGVDEGLAAAGVDHDPVEDVLAFVVEHPVDLADLRAVGGMDGHPAR